MQQQVPIGKRAALIVEVYAEHIYNNGYDLLSANRNNSMSNAIVDKVHFQPLAEQDPQTVCRRSLCRYDPLSRCYSITVWGIDYRIFPHAFSIECHHGKINRPHRFFDLFVIQYLTADIVFALAVGICDRLAKSDAS